MLLEDIHWADDSSLDLLRDLGPLIAGARILVICAARPTLFERRPHWGEGPVPALGLDLTPLSPLESRRLVEEILRRIRDLPAELSELIVNSAEGNPYYIEELIKMLIEEGVIHKPSDGTGERSMTPGGAGGSNSGSEDITAGSARRGATAIGTQIGTSCRDGSQRYACRRRSSGFCKRASTAWRHRSDPRCREHQ